MVLAIISLVTALLGGLITFLTWYCSGKQQVIRLTKERVKNEKKLRKALLVGDSVVISSIELELVRLRAEIRRINRIGNASAH